MVLDSPNRETSPPVVGLAGPIGSGKTSLAEFLRDKHGFGYVRYSQVLEDMLRAEGKPVTRESLQEFGEGVFRTIGGRGLTEMVIQRIPSGRPTVVDGIRHLDDSDTLRKVFNGRFTLIYLDSSADDRFRRLQARNSVMSFGRKEFDRISRHPIESEVELLKASADLVVVNDRYCGWPADASDSILKYVGLV
jgi:dephospho-CoA kinase